MNLITIADLEIYLKTTIEDENNPSFDSADELLYKFLITAVSEKVELVCNRTFSATDYISRISGSGTTDLILDQAPIISLTEIKYIDMSGNTSDIDTDGIVIEYDESILYKSTPWTLGRHNIQVTYLAGYATIPDALKLVICEKVVSDFNSIGTGVGIKSESLGDYKYEMFGNVSDEKEFIGKLNLWILQDII